MTPIKLHLKKKVLLPSLKMGEFTFKLFVTFVHVNKYHRLVLKLFVYQFHLLNLAETASEFVLFCANFNQVGNMNRYVR